MGRRRPPPPFPLPPPGEEEARLEALGLPRVFVISPSSGEMGGGTTITVTGGRLSSGDGYLCRFGSEEGPWRAPGSNRVPATHDGGSLLYCHATPAALAGARVALWRSFSSSAGTTLGGTAEIRGGRLQLGSGRADENAIGHARFSFPSSAPARPLRHWIARFLLTLTAGDGGGSLSFHYAALPHLTPPPDVGSMGLCVVFDATIAAHALEVRLDGEVVWRQSIGGAAKMSAGALHAHGNSSVPVTVGLAPAGPHAMYNAAPVAAGTPLLTVTHADTTHIDAMPLPGLRPPEAAWEFGLVSRAGAAALTAARDSSKTAEATVGNDGIHMPPECDAGKQRYDYASAECGVVGDVHAVQAFEVEDLEPTAPPRTASVPFQVSINAQQFSADPARFTYLAPHTPASVFPLGGSGVGGTTVTISGAHLAAGGSHLLCAFGTSYVEAPAGALGGREWASRAEVTAATHHAAVSGDPDDQGYLTCSTPPLTGDALQAAVEDEGGTPASLRISLNGQQFAPPLPFVYFGQPAVSAISPSCGPATGATSIALSGAQLASGTAYRCKFDPGGAAVASTVVASYASGGGMRCVSPSLAMGLHTLEVSLNDQDYTRSGRVFEVYAKANTFDVVPRSGHSNFSTEVNITRNVGTGCDHRCRIWRSKLTDWYDHSFSEEYTYSMVVKAGWISDEVTTCVVPPLKQIDVKSPNWYDPTFEEIIAEGPVIVEVSLNAQQYSTDEAPFIFEYFAPYITGTDPKLGPIGGGSAVQFDGKWLSLRAEAPTCAFGGHVVPATLINDETAWCRSPPYVDIASADGGAAGGTVSVQFSLNGREFAGDGLTYRGPVTDAPDSWTFTYAPNPEIGTVSPMLGPTLGATQINVTSGALEGVGGIGKEIYETGAKICRFELEGARQDIFATLEQFF